MTAQIGTVIHATLLSEDLIPAFMDKLDELKDDRALLPITATFEETERCKAEYSRLTDLQAGIERRQHIHVDSYWIDGEAEEDINTLRDELESFSPPYCYFGTHEGDGADFGFWICTESVDDARTDGDLPSGDQLPDEVEGEFLVISDHGNAELYVATDGEWKNVWGVV